MDKMKTQARRVWNRITAEEEQTVLKMALAYPELSARLLAVKITDETDYAVSESTVYRILKKYGLLKPRPVTDMPAAKEWRHKTTRINEIWQVDATTFFIVGWGFYKLIPVLDDYSRKILAWVLMPDETAESISHAIERAVEAVGLRDIPELERPKALTDNGPGFTAEHLCAYLKAQGIRHIFGRPYHPQTQGKIERFNRKIKDDVCLVVYSDPETLEKAISQFVERYNQTPHEALKNVSPNDVYAGRREEILKAREAKKRWTLARRRIINLEFEGKQPEGKQP